MTRKSEARRASRRMKQAQKWKTPGGADRTGVANSRELSVSSKPDEPPLAGWRRPAELALGE